MVAEPFVSCDCFSFKISCLWSNNFRVRFGSYSSCRAYGYAGIWAFNNTASSCITRTWAPTRPPLFKRSILTSGPESTIPASKVSTMVYSARARRFSMSVCMPVFYLRFNEYTTEPEGKYAVLSSAEISTPVLVPNSGAKYEETYVPSLFSTTKRLLLASNAYTC